AEDAAGPSAPGDDAPGLAITDSSGRQSRDSLEMPSGSLVRIRLTPGASGDLQLFCLYPTGSVAGILNGSVKKDRSYSTWMQAELQGDYELWFVVNGARSNSVKIRVLEAEAMQDSMAGQTGMLSGVRAPALSYSMAPAAAAGAGPSIGLSAGGAKDVSSFRENINQSYLPLPSDVTYFMITTLRPERPRSAISSSVPPTAMPSPKIHSPESPSTIYPWASTPGSGIFRERS
ncbi:MAG: uncharacterized protein CG443_346, partial [Methanosaeta sp. ASP1-1]